jgi:mono/diheme cytochrome c family protein
MRRFSVPPGPIAGMVAMSGLAFMLIVVIVARSPYTHANLSPAGYDRTEITYLDEEYPFEGLGLAEPRLARTGDAAHDGQLLFFAYGCASCHGLKAQGGVVGPKVMDSSPLEVRRALSQGPKGMPSFTTSGITDEQTTSIVAWLQSLSATRPSPTAEQEGSWPVLLPAGLASLAFIALVTGLVRIRGRVAARAGHSKG